MTISGSPYGIGFLGLILFLVNIKLLNMRASGNGLPGNSRDAITPPT